MIEENEIVVQLESVARKSSADAARQIFSDPNRYLLSSIPGEWRARDLALEMNLHKANVERAGKLFVGLDELLEVLANIEPTTQLIGYGFNTKKLISMFFFTRIEPGRLIGFYVLERNSGRQLSDPTIPYDGKYR